MYHLNLILFYTQYLVIVKFHTIIVKDPRDSLYFQQIKTKNVVPIKKLKYNLFLSFPSVKITVRPPPQKKDQQIISPFILWFIHLTLFLSLLQNSPLIPTTCSISPPTLLFHLYWFSNISIISVAFYNLKL